MADLKPIGSEKLKGQDKLNRILEIARYKETKPSNINETSRSEYNIGLADGQTYEIVKERLGYIIKKVVSEGTTEYIEPMKNRKYFSSYSQAFKRLNLLASELNRLNENAEGISLYGEQKKVVLRTPKSDSTPDEETTPVPATPPVVPAPQLPPNPEMEEPEAQEPEGEDMGGTDLESPEMGGEDMSGEDMGGEDIPSEKGVGSEGGEKTTFKTIQKLTGKLTYKIRELSDAQGMTSEDVKYVINMVLSSLDLGSLSEEDKEDILSKFDETESDKGMGGFEPEPQDEMGSDMEDMSGEDMTSDVEPKEYNVSAGAILDSIFGESKVDKVISKYFEVSKKEILENRQKFQNQKTKKNNFQKSQISEVKRLSESSRQELAAFKFLEENTQFKIVGKTNLKNLVFIGENNKKVKITPQGFLI